MSAFALEDTHGIEARRVGAEGTGDPVDSAVLADDGPFGIEVVHILGPVFDGRIGQGCIVTDEQFNAARMKVGDIVFRRRTAFDEVDLGSLFDDDHGMFELACARCIETEIALQRDGDVDAGRHIDEGATGPDGTVKGGELVIRRRDELHEVGLDDVFIFFKGRIEVGVDDALLDQFVLDAVIDDFRVVLGADAGEGCLFGFRDPQAVEGIFDVIRYVVPVSFHLSVRADVGDDVIHIEFADIRTPIRIVHMVEDVQRFEAEIEHPFRFMFLFGNFADNIFRQAGIGLIGIGEIFLKIIHIAEISKGIDFLTFFCQFFFFLFDKFFFVISHSCTSYYPLYAS